MVRVVGLTGYIYRDWKRLKEPARLSCERRAIAERRAIQKGTIIQFLVEERVYSQAVMSIKEGDPILYDVEAFESSGSLRWYVWHRSRPLDSVLFVDSVSRFDVERTLKDMGYPRRLSLRKEPTPRVPD